MSLYMKKTIQMQVLNVKRVILEVLGLKFNLVCVVIGKEKERGRGKGKVDTISVVTVNNGAVIG